MTINQKIDFKKMLSEILYLVKDEAEYELLDPSAHEELEKIANKVGYHYKFKNLRKYELPKFNPTINRLEE